MASDDPRPSAAIHPRMERLLFGRPITPARAARLIAGASLLLTLVGGVLARLVDKKDFGSLGDALWWSLQTVTTVGYGDVVPRHTSGRLIGTVLMLNGIAIISVITAGVTAMLIEQSRRERAGSDEAITAALERIDARLAEMQSDGSGRAQAPGD
jgi:voltage-gated potassium channel